MNGNQAIATGALYYPYIHIRDLNWLKANLLIFPNIRRMIPEGFTPPDDADGIREFTAWLDNKPPLLQSAHLWNERSIQAQQQLASKLKEDIKSRKFVSTYGKEAARAMVKDRRYGFQIHTGKLQPELKNALTDRNKLAWEPVTPNSPEYIEVHPRVGEAVMSTLAVACAQADGLDIVGDKRTGPLHRCLLEKDLNAIYETWLKPDDRIEQPEAATGEELFEFILGIPGDLTMLSAEKLRAIADERQPIDELIRALRDRAAQISAMDPGKEREAAFKQAASEVMQKWNNDRNNFSGFVREFFGRDAANLTTSFAEKVADKTLTGMAAGAATKATVAGAVGAAGWLGSLADGGLIGAGGGLVIGLIVHSGRTYYKRRQVEKNSPYRFLTTLEDAGVVLQSEAILHE